MLYGLADHMGHAFFEMYEITRTVPFACTKSLKSLETGFLRFFTIRRKKYLNGFGSK
jgi:hypothetical protein